MINITKVFFFQWGQDTDYVWFPVVYLFGTFFSSLLTVRHILNAGLTFLPSFNLQSNGVLNNYIIYGKCSEQNN